MSWLILAPPPLGKADDAEAKAVEFVEKLGGKLARDEKLPGRPIILVDLNFSRLTNAGLKELAPLKHLTTLDLGYTNVTDVGLKELAALKNLTTLDLRKTTVTDAGLKELAALKNLTTLNLTSTKVTDAGLKEFKKALPKCVTQPAARTEVAVGPMPKVTVGPMSGNQREDIRQVLNKSGFDEKTDWSFQLSPFVRFGSKETTDKFLRGDKFDKIEINKAAKDHRDAIRSKSFLVKGLKFRPFVRDDIETRGLVAELALPMRVRGKEPFYDDVESFTGALGSMHPSELDARQNWFLTKTGKLQQCTPAEAAIVIRNDGVVAVQSVGVVVRSEATSE